MDKLTQAVGTPSLRRFDWRMGLFCCHAASLRDFPIQIWMILLHPTRTTAGPSTSLGAKNGPNCAQDDSFVGMATKPNQVHAVFYS